MDKAKEFVDKTNTIRQLYKSRQKTKTELETEYASFKDENTHLFDMICSPSCDDGVLFQMLAQYVKVKSGDRTQHDASVHVGSLLVDTFVKPSLPS